MFLIEYIYNYAVYILRQFILNNSLLIWIINKGSELTIKYEQHKMYKFFETIKIENIEKTDINKISCLEEDTNQYSIQNYQKLLCDDNNYNYKNKEWIDNLLLKIIESNILNIDRKLTLDDFVILDILSSTGSYYPRFHTDLEWYDFKQSDGFQLWYLIKNEYKNQGNMFILDDYQQNYRYTPSKLNFNCAINDSKIEVVDNIAIWQPKSYNETNYISIHDDFSVKYLDLKVGDCFIFGRNLWHCSDWRDNFSKRIAINLRVIIKNEDGSINCSNNVGSFNPLKHKLIDNKLYNLERYDLSGLY